MNSALLALVTAIALSCTSFIAGQRVQANADKAAQLDAAVLDAEIARHRNRSALAVGVGVEQAQQTNDRVFQKIRSDYEIEQRNNPGLGCVLDPVSLRLWNAANTQSDTTAPGESADQVSQAADPAADGKRGEQPSGVGAPVSPVREQASRLD